MAKKKTVKIIITQEMLDRIIPPIQSLEEELEFRKRCDEEYEKSKQEILERMKKNKERYKNE